MGFGHINATIGIDLGKERDHTALVTVERLERFYGASDENSLGDNVRGLESVYVVRRCALAPLQTPYPVIVDMAADLVYKPELRHARVVLDGGGVGGPVADMFTERYKRDPRILHRPRAMTMTGGTGSTSRTVSKLALVSKLVRVTQEGRLHIPDDLPLAEAMRSQLRTYQIKYSKAGNAAFESETEKDHDDIVMALCLAIWKDHWQVTPHGLNADGSTVDRHGNDE